MIVKLLTEHHLEFLSLQRLVRVYTYQKTILLEIILCIYTEPIIREPLYFMASKSISGVTSTCCNTCIAPVGHTGDDT